MSTDPLHQPSLRAQRSIRRQAAAERTTAVVLGIAFVITLVVASFVTWCALARRFMFAAAAVACLVLAGCSSVRVAEEDVYRALVAADDGVTWATGHEAEIKAAVAKAAALDPENKTLQSAAAKASVALDNGDLGAAQAFVRSTRIVFSPSPVPATAGQ